MLFTVDSINGDMASVLAYRTVGRGIETTSDSGLKRDPDFSCIIAYYRNSCKL